MSEGNYTLKEMVQELRNSGKSQNKDISQILFMVESINKHLEQLNSKVATNVKNIGELDAKVDKNDTLTRAWTWKVLLGVTMIGSFVWIQESRDVILSILSALF